MKILAIVLLALFAFPVQSINVGMDGAPTGLLVPGAVAVIRGVEWLDTDEAINGSFGGDEALAGYSVQIAGRPCRLTYISAELLAFLVADDLEPGARILQVLGPAGAFSANVEIAQYRPRLVQQLVDGDSHPECCVVATSSRNLYPELFLGQPIPVSPTTYNYISVQAVGLPTDRSTEITIVLQGAELYEVPAMAYPVFGFNGVTNICFFAPPCANGDYRASLRLGGQQSPEVLIRFASNCQPTAIERSATPRSPRGPTRTGRPSITTGSRTSQP